VITGPELAAVLFDMDGTLLDSEKIWDVALDDLAEWLGGRLSPAGRTRMVGTPLGRSIAILHDDLGIEADAEASSAYLLGRAAELFERPLPWRPGARELLDAVAEAGVPAGLVTSTHRGLTKLALRTLGGDRFAAVVCGDDVAATKPAPDPYLTAAAQLGVTPEHCVAIEDSPVGLRAARAAGCAVLVVPNDVAIEPDPGIEIRPTLEGVTVADLRALVIRHAEISTATLGELPVRRQRGQTHLPSHLP
jgi:HAD superfamily hydrolase (TIGR01509 family)